jgi:hypothetical protein
MNTFTPQDVTRLNNECSARCESMAKQWHCSTDAEYTVAILMLQDGSIFGCMVL